MATLSVGGLDEESLARVKQAASGRGQSVNAYRLDLIRRESGLAGPDEHDAHRDLDHLAGTWSETEGLAFEATQADFERVDEDLWR